LNAALEHVTDEQRQVLVLRFLLELSTAETARVMAKSRGAIKTLQHRALAAARRALSTMDPAAWGEKP
jgi:RNA polymerase sigma-70 factor (ECF subfamily)